MLLADTRLVWYKFSSCVLSTLSIALTVDRLKGYSPYFGSVGCCEAQSMSSYPHWNSVERIPMVAVADSYCGNKKGVEADTAVAHFALPLAFAAVHTDVLD